jgi:predicted O-methyltransferase YrrM
VASSSQLSKELEEAVIRLTQIQRGAAETLYRKIEALVGLYSTLDVRLPLPTMVGYAMAADVASALVTEILVGKPTTIVELGSGVSTLLTAYAIRQAGHGRLFSFEHDEKYLAQTREYLDNHDLESLVELFYAPLSDLELEKGVWQWYTIQTEDLFAPIDLLVVDGPPARIQTLSRYPALPALHEYLSETGTVFVDDYFREDEAEAVRSWLHEFPDLHVEDIPGTPGATFLRRVPYSGTESEGIEQPDMD